MTIVCVSPTSGGTSIEKGVRYLSAPAIYARAHAGAPAYSRARGGQIGPWSRGLRDSLGASAALSPLSTAWGLRDPPPLSTAW